MRREGQPLIAPDHITKDVSIEIRLGFIRKVYGILAVMLLLTVGAALPFRYCSRAWIDSHSWILILVAFVLIATICTVACQKDAVRKFPNCYIFLLVYTACIGILVGFATALYSWQSVLLAVGVTFCIVLTLTFYTCFAGVDFVTIAPYFVVVLALFMFFGIILIVLSLLAVEVYALTMFYAFLGALVFCFFIVFDTQLILGEAGGHSIQFSLDDYAFAALSLYADIINLFLFILRILGDRDVRKF